MVIPDRYPADAPTQVDRTLLGRKRLTIVTAESCTGGLIAGALTDIPGLVGRRSMAASSPMPTRPRSP